MSGILDGGGSRPAEPGSAGRLTQLAAGCFAFGTWPYLLYCPARLGLASFASYAPGERA
jgi:hypothetical protein